MFFLALLFFLSIFCVSLPMLGYVLFVNIFLFVSAFVLCFKMIVWYFFLCLSWMRVVFSVYAMVRWLFPLYIWVIILLSLLLFFILYFSLSCKKKNLHILKSGSACFSFHVSFLHIFLKLFLHFTVLCAHLPLIHLSCVTRFYLPYQNLPACEPIHRQSHRQPTANPPQVQIPDNFILTTTTTFVFRNALL